MIGRLVFTAGHAFALVQSRRHSRCYRGGDRRHVDEDLSTDDVTYLTGVGTVGGSRSGWKACNPGIDVTPAGTGSDTFFAVVDSAAQTVSVSAYAEVETVLAGISTELFIAPLEPAYAKGGATVQIQPRQPFGDLCPHNSFGTATIEGTATGP